MIMACNHDIAYLVRNACNANARVQSGAAPGHDRARAATHQHVVVMKLLSQTGNTNHNLFTANTFYRT